MGVDPTEAYHSSRRHVSKQGGFTVGANSTGATGLAAVNNKPDPKRMTGVTAITFNPQTPGGAGTGLIGGVTAGGGQAAQP